MSEEFDVLGLYFRSFYPVTPLLVNLVFLDLVDADATECEDETTL